MNEKALKTLEFHKILHMLEERASSPMGKDLCRALRPSEDLSAIRGMQEETSAAASRLLRKGAPAFSAAHDIRPSLKSLKIGRTLNGGELLRIASLLENVSRIAAYGRRERKEDTADCLDPMFSALEPLTNLQTEIRRCLLSESEVADDASPALRKIRRAQLQCSDRIHSQLNSILNGPMRQSLQDAVITMRNGRYCVPVKADARGAIDGMVHDQSSTGATLFIEPMSVVRLNNEIKELQLQEAAEIEAILASLSASAAGNTMILESDLTIMSSLDHIFARGQLALDMNASEPVFNDDGRIHLRKARHPLIDKKQVVPIDITLGDTFDLLIVTGPNTGGKTVSLKTTGLLTLMGQAGLHIPCMDRSELSVFSEVYADIGDEQSIEQSLSTFSAHMHNIVSFLDKADARSLVLFDELGAGTDPTEGAALAIAILSYLHRQKIRTMATTHYSELKVFALTTEGVENASCEFDVETLRPTYRLLIGVPGKSNAFAISQKLGIPEHIIDDARSHIGSRETSLEDVLAGLEEKRLRLEELQTVLEQRFTELRYREKQQLSRERTFEDQKDALLEKANTEAAAVLQEAKDYADKTLRDFRKFNKEHVTVDAADLQRKRSELRKHMRSRTAKPASEPVRTGSLRPDDIHIGDSVRVLSMKLNGIVRSKPDAKGQLFVQMGILRSKVDLSDLELIDEPDVHYDKASHSGSGKIKVSKSLSVRPEIRVIGKTVDDAIPEIDKYLDDAYLAHLDNVRIVHGKGTGALRSGIHAFLRRAPHVAEYHLAEYGEGDAGVTIVRFKK